MCRRMRLLLMMSLMGCAAASGQDLATIVGTVTDSSGGVVPHAKVTVLNPDKGFTREVVSNAAGEYTAAKIPIGDYELTAEAAGFQKSQRTGVTLSVGGTLRVDFRMMVGQVNQQVTVTGNVPRVETETAAISDIITGNQVQNLELNGRNFTALALLVPGAAPDNGLEASHVGITANLNISFNGSRQQYNNWELDNGPNTDDTSGSTTNTFPNIDSIAEFRISTSTYGAEMGDTPVRSSRWSRNQEPRTFTVARSSSFAMTGSMPTIGLLTGSRGLTSMS
jgi:hypothetical protein